MAAITLNGFSLTLDHLVDIARRRRKVTLAASAARRMEQARAFIQRLLEEDRPVYGVNTGFGKLSSVRIDPQERVALQYNLIRSHAVGVGDPLPEDVVRAAMVLRANLLARGHSGVRPQVVQLLLEFLNRGITPIVPSRGSVGASGDLAPLAHIALALIGEGMVQVHGGPPLPSRVVMNAEGLSPLELEPKEGLALINGTSVSTAVLALALHDLLTLVEQADVVAAMSFEAVGGVRTEFHPLIGEVRPYEGSMAVHRVLWSLTEGSRLLETPLRVQDPYSLRCVPQIHGAIRDLLAYALRVVETELNAVSDNPLVFPEEERVLSGGNFHGQPIAFAADAVSLAATSLAVISERRTNRLMDPSFSGLPPFLIQDSGLHSGLMMVQVTQAALVGEMQARAHPHSVQNVSTSGDQEDVVPMAVSAALNAREQVESAYRVLAMELFTAFQALHLRGPDNAAPPIRRVYAELADRFKPVTEDRPLFGEIKEAEELLRSGRFCLERVFGEK